MDKMNIYLVTGLESSGTRMVSKWVANVLGVIEKYGDWNGRWEIERGGKKIVHRSLPHGDRDNFISLEKFGGVEELQVVICIRDFNIAYQSALKLHNRGDEKLAQRSLMHGRDKILEFMESEYKVNFFNYEQAIFLDQKYLDWWAESYLSCKNTSKMSVKNENWKYIKNGKRLQI